MKTWAETSVPEKKSETEITMTTTQAMQLAGALVDKGVFEQGKKSYQINPAQSGGLFYHRITLCITVFGVLGAWGGNGLELQPLVRIKIARPATKLRLVQNSKERANPNKKRTKWCVFKLVPVVGMPSPVKSPRIPIVSDSRFISLHHT